MTDIMGYSELHNLSTLKERPRPGKPVHKNSPTKARVILEHSITFWNFIELDGNVLGTDWGNLHEGGAIKFLNK